MQGMLRNFVLFVLIGAGIACGPAAAQATTTVCNFTTGARAGTTFDYAPYGVHPIPVGSPCTDGQGSNGTAIAPSGSGGAAGSFPSTGPNNGMTTICSFNSGPRAGTTYDYAQMGLQPIPVGTPCTDGASSGGVAVASNTPGPAPAAPVAGPSAGMTTVCRFTMGPKAGTSFDYAPYGVHPIPVGSPCTDGLGSNGTAGP